MSLSLIAIQALALENVEPHGLDGHQVNTIIYQSINVAALLAGLFYVLRKPVRLHFTERRRLFIELAERAQNFKKAAEQERMEIQVRLSKLEGTVDESISRAKAEAIDLKKNLIAEAKEASHKIKIEAESSAKLEIQKAKNLLREQMIGEAAKITLQHLSTKLSDDDQRRLQNEFVDNIKHSTREQGTR